MVTKKGGIKRKKMIDRTVGKRGESGTWRDEMKKETLIHSNISTREDSWKK